MPTYEYVCEKCGHQFEKLQPISDAPLKTCPKDLCGRKRWGKGKVKRAISTGGGLIFKGSGFYQTDYRSSSYQEGAKAEKSGAKVEGGVANSESAPKAEAAKPAAAAPAAASSVPAKAAG